MFAQITTFGGGSGMSLPTGVVKEIASSRDMRESIIYWTALVLVLVVLGFVYGLLRTRQGLALTAIRDSERASESLGINIWWTKFVVYVLAAGRRRRWSAR